jgi:hypothetical protein
MQVFIENISSFSTIRNEGLPAIKDLTILRDIPESAVKQAIAEIIDETTEPDWGGEQSDLYTSHLTVNGKRVTAAFIFKGPAKFHPMTMADLGKNGDQICRLFQEPADLFILQHCHKVTSAVRAHMRAFVTQIGAPKAFCIIDGSDTLRLLRAYKKCGQKPTVKPPTIPPNNDPDDWDE